MTDHHARSEECDPLFLLVLSTVVFNLDSVATVLSPIIPLDDLQYVSTGTKHLMQIL
jgi:hypothetical protein